MAGMIDVVPIQPKLSGPGPLRLRTSAGEPNTYQVAAADLAPLGRRA